jgi:hypothetical protein
VNVNYVYEHKTELRGYTLPSAGEKGRLRFELAEVRKRLSAGASCQTARQSDAPQTRMVTGNRRHRGKRPLGTKVELLPIRAR